MNKGFIGLTVLTLAVAAPEFAQVAAQGGDAKEVLVKGRVVCQTCYLRDKTNVGQAMDYDDLNDGDSEMCGVYCAWNNRPLAILTDDGKLYTVTGKLAEPGDLRNHNGNVIRQNTPYPLVQRHFNHIVDIYGHVTDKGNGQYELAGNRLLWVVDTKDWRVGSDLETKYGEGGGVFKGGQPVK